MLTRLITLLFMLSCSGCAIITVADTAISVAATTVKIGATVVGTTVDVAAGGVKAITDDSDEEN